MAETIKRLTLQNIADMVGVSKTIVSKVVNHNPDVKVGAERRAEIEEIVRKYNYTPLGAAQSLATRKTRQIAFLLSSQTTLGLANSYYGTILAGVHDACGAHHYQCVVNVQDFTGNNRFMLPENLKKLSIDGCILTGFIRDEALRKLTELRIPMVLLGWEPGEWNIPVISRDTLQDYDMYLKYFASCGHFHIWLGKDSASDRNFFHALQKKHHGFSLKFLLRNNSPNEFEYGRIHAEAFLKLPEKKRPTLLFASDHFCVSFLNRLHQEGLACPRDISIVTESDTPLARWCIPSLTAISQDRYQLGIQGTNLLIRMLNNSLTNAEAVEEAGQTKIKSTLIERDSVKNIK